MLELTDNKFSGRGVNDFSKQSTISPQVRRHEDRALRRAPIIHDAIRQHGGLHKARRHIHAGRPVARMRACHRPRRYARVAYPVSSDVEPDLHWIGAADHHRHIADSHRTPVAPMGRRGPASLLPPSSEGVAWLAQTAAARQRRSQVAEVLDSDVFQDADVVRRRVDPGHTRCLDILVFPFVHKARDQAAMLAELVGEVDAIVEIRRPQRVLARRLVGYQVFQDSGL